MVLTGLERIVRGETVVLKNRTYGLVTNPTGVDSNLVPNWQILRQAKVGRLAALFGPEHGWRGDTQDELAVESSRDPGLDLPVYSLYGEQRCPTDAMLDGLDSLVFDIQDVGVRFYTYISTMYLCMEACGRRGLDFIVLDRPNPVNGLTVEGGILPRELRSFLGIYSLPIRHGLTVGELAKLFQRDTHCNAEVVTMDGWHRCQHFDDTGLPWVLPSPNLPSLETALVYPGMCLVEGTNVSEGRGTTRPFETFGAPWLDADGTVNALSDLTLPGVGFRACAFTPTYGKYEGELCRGVQVHVRDRNALRAVPLGLHVIDVLRRLHPQCFDWRQDAGDGRTDNRPMIDWLAGTHRLRAGHPVSSIIEEFSEEAAAFREIREPYLLYR